MKKEHRVLYGTFKDLVFYRSREIINEAYSLGWEVVRLDGKKSSKSEINQAFEVGLFDSGDKLIVLSNPTALKNLTELSQKDSHSVLYLSDRVVPKALMGVKKKECFELPKSKRKLNDWYVKFFQKMVADQGKEISVAICESVVQRVGQDVGVLTYEALKISYVSEGDEVTPREVLSVIAPLKEMDGVLLVDAVLSWNPTYFLKTCARFEKNRDKDPTMGVVAGLLHKNIVQLLSVRLCIDGGVTSVQGISEEIDVQSWLVEDVLLPKARRFTTKKLREILGVLYHCENLAVSGVVSPFSAFKTGLLCLMVS